MADNLQSNRRQALSQFASVKAAPVGQAQLTNMGLALRTMLDCMEAPEALPRLGLFYGPSGYGKSVAAAFAGARVGAAWVAAKSIWTQRSILEAIAAELGLVGLARTGPHMLGQIADHLNHHPRPLIIDEMDHLVKKQSVEIIRDIHDATRVAILMIGEETLPARLKGWERFDNRILIATPAQPASHEDALRLRDQYCTRVGIADDLVAAIAHACRGVIRRIITNLVAVERHAIEQGASAIDADWWGDRRFHTGDIATRRAA